MKKALLLTILANTLIGIYAQTNKKVDYKKEALLLRSTIEQFHVAPRPVNDQFSKDVFKLFLDRLDPDRLIFTEVELNKLRAFETKLDEEWKSNGWTFVPAVTSTYKSALERSKKIYSDILENKLAADVKATSFSKRGWVADEPSLRMRWTAAIRVSVMERCYRSGNSECSFSNASLATERQFRDRQLTRILEPADRLNGHVSEMWLKAVAAVFDAHSQYLGPAAMELFLESMSTDGYQFGFMLEEEEETGEVVVSGLTPGSPAWQSGELQIGDRIEEVTLEGEPPVDVKASGIDELRTILDESAASKISMKVGKPTGEINTVQLKKSKISVEENAVKSYVLEGVRKIGYIELPGFYHNWGDEKGRRCADDVAKEVIKLKKLGIDGLILDLRFNGGGSVQEAIDLAGLFIDVGPIGIARNQADKLSIIKETHSGTVYDGPLLILVNPMSASASEILSSALQDHKRAIIAGTPTFGKGTMQNILPLNGVSSTTKGGTGSVAVTTLRFYRIDGRTTQGNGVIPDVVIPDLYQHLDLNEGLLPHAFKPDSVIKKIDFPITNRIPKEKLRQRSDERLKQNEFFRMITTQASDLRDLTLDDETPLDWTQFKSRREKLTKLLGAIESMSEKFIPSFTVQMHENDQERTQLDAYIQSLFLVRMKKLEKDISLDEAFHILCDYIEIKD